MANFITTFLQTAADSRFPTSLFPQALYNFHVLGLTTLQNPGYTPYYDQLFFSIIKDVKEKTPMNPMMMTVKQWYRHLLEKNMTMTEIDEEGRMSKIPCRIEERDPETDWSHSYRLSRIKGLSLDMKSFWFKQIHQLHTTKLRVHQVIPMNSSLCWCESGEDESYLHCFFACQKNSEAGNEILRLTRVYDYNLTPEQAIRLQVHADDVYERTAVVILSVGLEYIWKNRLQKKSTSVAMVRSELECAINLRRRSCSRILRETAAMMSNTLLNFN